LELGEPIAELIPEVIEEEWKKHSTAGHEGIEPFLNEPAIMIPVTDDKQAKGKVP
jgi:hypothetical protein